MAFMVPTIYRGRYILLDNPREGGCTVPEEDYEEGNYPPAEGWTIEERGEAWLYRLSAPGYMDCTEWGRADTEAEARAALEEEESVCPDCGEDVDPAGYEDGEDIYVCRDCGSLLPSGIGQRGAWIVEGETFHYHAPSPRRALEVREELQSLGGSMIEGEDSFLYCLPSNEEEAREELIRAGFSIKEQG